MAADEVSFESFYAAVHKGRSPLPWQSRLARMAATEGWPAEIGVPTGLGKTSTIDIAVWALAAQAERQPSERSAPTRIWYVVNRRLLVDAASEHAERLAVLLAEPQFAYESDESVDASERAAWRNSLSSVSSRLISIAGAVEFEVDKGRISGPLFVSRLRGGAQPGRRPPHPAQPSVICATVPMFGSRLLFRGYGVSNRMWSIDAALAGTDSLVLLDEAHLSRPLQTLVGVLPSADAPSAGALIPVACDSDGLGSESVLPWSRGYPSLVSLTATGSATSSRFELDEDDLAHPVVRTRLNAAKPTTVKRTTVKELASDLAAEVIAGLDRLAPVGSDLSAVVFVNQPRTARLVDAAIRKRSKGALDPIVLTGQIRGPEADLVRERLLSVETGVPTGRRVARPDCTVSLVIATQTLEVGADLDFDLLVSELAGVRAITQRLGRLNRVGMRNHAQAVLLDVVDAKSGGLYGDEAIELGKRLPAFEVDLGPAAISSVLGAPSDNEAPTPELLGSHLWEFSKTSSPPHDAAPPEPFFNGFGELEYSVGVCWRAEPPEIGCPLLPAPSDAEFIDVSISDLGPLLPIARVRLGGASVESVTDLAAVRPGDRFVLGSSAGRYGRAGWDPDSGTAVLDLSPLIRRSVRLTPAALANLMGYELSDVQVESLEPLRRERVDESGDDAEITVPENLAREVLGWLRDAKPNESIGRRWWNLDQATSPAIEFDSDGRRPRLTWRIPSARFDPRIDALDELSLGDFDEDQRVLRTHLETVGQRAARIATQLGVSAHLVEAIAESGRCHDLGKAHPGFQRWLGYPDNEARLYAKSDRDRSRVAGGSGKATGWPLGSRHELLSVQVIDAALPPLPEADLVRHLVISHHGHGRPFCPISSSAPATVDVERDGSTRVDALVDPSRPDWAQPERFRSLNVRFGYWGLALLEAVLRQADHVVSRADEVL